MVACTTVETFFSGLCGSLEQSFFKKLNAVTPAEICGDVLKYAVTAFNMAFEKKTREENQPASQPDSCTRKQNSRKFFLIHFFTSPGF